MKVCDRCKTNLDGKEDFEVSSWDDEQSFCQGEDQIASDLCRKCFDELKRWLRGWLKAKR